MIRALALRVLLFAMPFAIYGAWLFLLRMRTKTEPERAPWTGLFIAGLSLVAASFIYVGLMGGETTKGIYIPPHVAKGVIVPGHVEQKP